MGARLGIVGTGPWARTFHVPAAQRSRHGALTAVLGRDRERTAALVGEGLACADLDVFLDRVDVVILAVPPEAQPGTAIAAARAGKHLLLEKPVAFDPAQARAVAAAVDAAGVRAVVFLPNLLGEPSASWLAGARDRGDWRHARIEQWSSVLVDRDGPFASSPWRRERGALHDTGPHGLAQLCTVLGRVRTVQAHRGGGDLALLRLEHASGAVGELALAADVAVADPSPRGLRLMGGSGFAEAPRADWAALTADAHDHALATLCDAKREARADASPAADLSLGVHLAEVLHAAERSMRSGRVEHVAEDC